MNYNLLTYFAFFWTLYVSYATGATLAKPSNETAKELDDAYGKLFTIQQQVNLEVTVKSSELQTHVSSGLQALNEKAEKVREAIESDQRKAKENNKDISKCTEQTETAIDELGQHELDKCMNPKEVTDARKEVANFAKLIDLLRDGAYACEKDGKEEDACVKKQIKEALEKGKAVQEKISNGLKQLNPEKQVECAKKESPALEKKLDTISNEYKECVKKIL